MDKKLNHLLSHTGDMDLKRRVRIIIKELDIEPGDKILDLGCGDGFYLNILSKLEANIKLYGCDIDTNALKSAKTNLDGVSVQLSQGDAMAGLDYKDNSFDKIIMTEVLEHIPNDKKALEEIRRILRPGGILVLSVPNLNYPMFWDPINWFLQRLFQTHIQSGFWAGIWNQHLRLYTLKDLIRLEEDCNFKVEKTKLMTYWCLPFNHYLLNFMARLFYSGKLSSHIASDVSKFNPTTQRKTLVVDLAFKFINGIDYLNEILPAKRSSVSIFTKLRK